jgi:two-component system, NtrC family, sensor histidine kinase HydH
MKLSSLGTRWAGWGLVAATFAMGVSLVVTSWSSYRAVTAASALVSRSQADAFLRSLVVQAFQSSGPLTASDLAAFLEEHTPAGLRYIAVYDEPERRLVDAGVPLAGRGDAPAAGMSDMSEVAGRLRTVFRAPTRPTHHGKVLAGRGDKPSDPPSGPGRRPPTITLEFEPLLAAQLSRGAVRAWRFSAAAALGLFLVAALFSRLLLQREAAERRFEERRRLAALGEMSSVLAHELRNPLASLKGHAQLLVERLPDSSRERAKAERIVLEAERLEALSTDLLDFSRSGPIERSESDPAALLRAAAESIDASRITVVADGAPARWSFDAQRLRQVLTNLLTNAIEASPAAVRAEARVATRAGRLLFSIRDHGEGLPAGQEQRLFEPFFTTRAKGTGLGLAVAHRIVEMHGGEIRASNHPEGGAVFEVELPRG